jgi:hypothetical protein
VEHFCRKAESPAAQGVSVDDAMVRIREEK